MTVCSIENISCSVVNGATDQELQLLGVHAGTTAHGIWSCQYHWYGVSHVVLKLQNVQVIDGRKFFHPYIQGCGMFLG